jgi:hypothetical protein
MELISIPYRSHCQEIHSRKFYHDKFRSSVSFPAMRFSLVTLGIGLALGTGLGLGLGHVRWTTPTTNISLADKPTDQKPEPNRVPPKLKTGHDWEDFQGNGYDLLARAKELEGNEQTYFIMRALETMPPEQFPILLAELVDESRFTQLQETALLETLRHWMKRDTSSAVAWVKSLPQEKLGANYVRVLSPLSESDAMAAWSLAQNVASPYARDLAMQSVVGSVARSDRNTALAFAKSMPVAMQGTAMLNIANALSASDPAEAYRLLQTNAPAQFNQVTSSLWENWGKQDPASALAAVAKLDSDVRHNAARNVYRSWARANPSAALLSAQALSAKLDRDIATGEVVTVWGTQDPAAALAWIKQQPQANRPRHSILGIVLALLKQNPSMAVDGLSLITSREERGNALNHFADRWAQADPEAAWRWFVALPEWDQQQALTTIGIVVRNFEPKRFMLEIGKISTPKSKQYLTRFYLQNLESNVSQRLAILNQLPREEARNLLNESPIHEGNEIVNFLVSDNITEGMQLLTKYEIPKMSAAWRVLAVKMARHDPEAAYSWLSRLSSEDRKLLTWGVLSGIGEKNPALAVERAGHLENPQERDELTRKLLSRWGQQNPESLEQAVAAMSGPTRVEALNVIMVMKMPVDAASVVSYFEEFQRSGSEAELNAMRSRMAVLAQNWAKQNAPTAAAWSSRITDQSARELYIVELASAWAREDPMAAGSWIQTLPAGKVKDGALGNLIRNMLETDPASAVVWAGQIQDTNEQQSNYFKALRALLQKDPTAGKQAVSEAPLSDTLKQKLLKEP